MDRAPEALRLLTPAVAEIVPSLTNPRKRRGLDIDSLTALAANLQANTLLQPITIRTLPAERLADTADMLPRPGYEIIVGERRWRAAQIAEWDTIHALLRDDLTQQQVEEMQLVENIERETLDPLDEAEGFALLRDKHSYTVQQIAAKCASGKGDSYVYKRLTLTNLVPEVRDAMYEPKPLDVSIALLIARYRADQQLDVLAYLRKMQANGEWPPFRSAQQALAKAFHLVLAHAPFDTESVDLVPEAGACTACPHRSSNQGDIFGDSPEDDACTNTGCFQQKRTAHGALLEKLLRKQGLKVIAGDDARQAKGGAKGVLIGYQRLDAVAYHETGGDGVEREVTFGDALLKMGKKAPKPQMFIDPDSLEPAKVIPADIAERLLPEEPPRGKSKSRATKSAAAANEGVAPQTTPEQDAITNREVERAVVTRVFDSIRVGQRNVAEMRLIARALFSDVDGAPTFAEEYLGWAVTLTGLEGRERAQLVAGMVDALPVDDLGQAIAMAAFDRFSQNVWTTDDALLDVVHGYGVDVLAVRDKVAEDLGRSGASADEEDVDA
jgi:ParB/RepB/Spo0J family partition protein